MLRQLGDLRPRAGRHAALREAHVERVLGGEQLRRGRFGVRGEPADLREQLLPAGLQVANAITDRGVRALGRLRGRGRLLQARRPRAVELVAERLAAAFQALAPSVAVGGLHPVRVLDLRELVLLGAQVRLGLRDLAPLPVGVEQARGALVAEPLHVARVHLAERERRLPVRDQAVDPAAHAFEHVQPIRTLLDQREVQLRQGGGELLVEHLGVRRLRPAWAAQQEQQVDHRLVRVHRREAEQRVVDGATVLARGRVRAAARAERGRQRAAADGLTVGRQVDRPDVAGRVQDALTAQHEEPGAVGRLAAAGLAAGHAHADRHVLPVGELRLQPRVADAPGVHVPERQVPGERTPLLAGRVDPVLGDVALEQQRIRELERARLADAVGALDHELAVLEDEHLVRVLVEVVTPMRVKRPRAFTASSPVSRSVLRWCRRPRGSGRRRAAASGLRRPPAAGPAR